LFHTAKVLQNYLDLVHKRKLLYGTLAFLH